MDGSIGSLVKILSMGAFNSLVSLWFRVLVCRVFSMLLFQKPEEGAYGVGLGQTALIPLPLTALVRTINSSTADSLRSPVCSHVVLSCNRGDFLHRRRLLCLWSLYNPSTDSQLRLIVCANTRFRRRIQHRDFLMSDPDHPATQ